jgi:Ca2+-binding EF-hand superfamily protein
MHLGKINLKIILINKFIFFARYFDVNENSIITIKELTEGFEKLNINIPRDELRSIIKRFDKEHLGNLRLNH